MRVRRRADHRGLAGAQRVPARRGDAPRVLCDGETFMHQALNAFVWRTVPVLIGVMLALGLAVVAFA